MIGETAQLITELLLKDNLSSGVASAESKLGTLNTTAGKTGAATSLASSGLSKVEGAAKKVGGAMSHAASQVSGLISNLGLFGGAGVALGIGDFLEQGISKAEALGLATEKVTGATNLGVQAASQAVAVFGKYGISADTTATMLGRLEKNAFTAANTHKLAAKFQTEYGLSLTDSSGKVKDATALLGTLSDYYLKNSDKAQTDAAMTKLIGRNWIDLIPILKLGSQGLKDQAAAAVAAGDTLNSALDVQSVDKFIAEQRLAGQEVQGLETQLGLLVMPDLTTALTSFTTYLMEHKDDIEGGFKDLLGFAEQIGGAITNVVIPAIQMIGNGWNMLPGPVKELLIGGFLANKAVKWTFGIDVAGLAGKALGGAISNLFKNATTAEMSVEAAVVNVGGAGAAIGGAETMAEGEAMGLAAGPIIAAALTAALAVGLAAVADNIQSFLGTDYAHNQDLPANQLSWPWGPKNTPHLDIGPFKNILGGDSSFTTPPAGPNSSGGTGGYVGQDQYQPVLKAVVDQGSAGVMARALAAGLHPTASGIDATLQRNADRIAVLIGDTNTILGKEWGSTSSKEAAIAARSAAAHGGKAPGQAAIDATFNRDLLRETQKIEDDGHTTATKIKDLQRLQQLAKDQGDTKTAQKIAKAIADEQTILKRAIDGTTTAINLKQFIATGILGSGSLTGDTPRVPGKTPPGLNHAAGFLGMVSAATQMIVGEAGNETVAVLRNPRSAKPLTDTTQFMAPDGSLWPSKLAYMQAKSGQYGSSGGGKWNAPLNVNLRVTTTVSNRQNETASAYSNRYGPTPVHAGAQ